MIENLLLRNGEPVTARHINTLAAAVNREQRRGIGIRQRVLPEGTITHYEGGGSGGSVPTFAPKVTPVKDGFAIGFELGLIAGVEPSIAGVAISKGATLFIPRESIDAIHGIGVYFRVTYNREWQAEKAEPIASVTPPKQAAWTFHKLAAIVFADGSFHRAMYWNEAVEVYNRGADGIARYAPHPQ